MTRNGDAQRPDPVDPAGAEVPRLPRGRGLRLSGPQMLRIAGLAILLVFLLVTQRPCANAVSSFVTGFDDRGSASTTMPRPGTVDVPGSPPAGSGASIAAPASGSSVAPAAPGSGNAAGSDVGLDDYERLRPGMTDDEVKAVIDRARAKANRASGPPRE